MLCGERPKPHLPTPPSPTGQSNRNGPAWWPGSRAMNCRRTTRTVSASSVAEEPGPALPGRGHDAFQPGVNSLFGSSQRAKTSVGWTVAKPVDQTRPNQWTVANPRMSGVASATGARGGWREMHRFQTYFKMHTHVRCRVVSLSIIDHLIISGDSYSGGGVAPPHTIPS